MKHVLSGELRETVAANLDRFERRALNDDDLRHAAVALVIAKAEASSEATILLTLRPMTMRRHSNQYALPGGRRDGDETLIQTALRELEEELRLSLPPDNVVGLLDDYATQSGFCVTPIVVWAGDAGPLDPDPEEVAEAFYIPFSELDSDAIPHFMETEHSEHPVLYSRLPTLGHSMYAPTAAILYQFREVCIRGLDTRVAHYSQPEFAWK